MQTHSPNLPPRIRSLFGKPPIMVGENEADYEQLLASVCADVEPTNLQEWLLVKDIVDSEWELLRLRGIKVAMLHAGLPGAAIRLASGMGSLELANSTPEIRKHLIGVLAGDVQAQEALGNYSTNMG
jgi:hypothetical protein